MVLLAGEQSCMVMRPYQVYAVQNIVECIHRRTAATATSGTPRQRQDADLVQGLHAAEGERHPQACSSWTAKTSTARRGRSSTNSRKAASKKHQHRDLVRRLLSDDYADKVIVTTIQKLGLALENSKRNKQRERNKGAGTPVQLERCMVFIFDECHRSQFGENHKAIKVLPQGPVVWFHRHAHLREQNASVQQIDGASGRYHHRRPVPALPARRTITHAIEDGNVLRFHIDYFKPKENLIRPNPAEAIAKRVSSTPSWPSTTPPPAKTLQRHAGHPPSTTPLIPRAVQRRCRPRSRPPMPTSSP